MRFTPDQLTAHLQKSLLPVYLVGGDVPLLTQEAITRIKNAAQQAGYDILTALETQGNFDAQQFYLSTHNLSLFNTKTLISLNLGERAPKQEIVNQSLLPYIHAVPKDKILLMTLSKLDVSLQNSAWVKAIDKVGAIIQIWPLASEQLPEWLSRRMRSRGLSANSNDIQLIADCVDGNLLAAAQCIEKLYLLYGSRFLNSEEIADSLSDNTKFDSFQWVNYALAGHSEKVVHSLYRLQADNSEPLLLLWTVARELRRLIALLTGLESGQTIEKLFEQQKVWKKHYQLYKRCLSKMKKIQLEKLLAEVHRLDLMIKGAAPGDIWNELLILSLKLAGKPL